MGPINYAAQLQDPSRAAFEGYATGLNMQGARQALQMNAAAEERARELHPLAVAGANLGMDAQQQGMDLALDANNRANNADARAAQQFAAQQDAQATEMARRQEFQDGMTRLADLGRGATAQDYAEHAAKFPEYAAAINETWSGLDDARKAGMSEVMGQAVTALRTDNVNRAISLLDDYATAAENSGDAAAAATARGLMQTANINPDLALAEIGLALQTVNPQMSEQIMGGGASVQRSDLIGGIANVQVMSDGSTRVIDTRTDQTVTGEDAAALIAEARKAEADAAGSVSASRQTGTNQANIETGGTAAASIEAAKIAQNAGLQAFEQLGQIRSNISNLGQAVEAIDAGARTGQLESRVPTWNAATLELRQLQSELGLDIIGSVTFGALSEGELRLALATALPTNMQEADLRNWLLQKQAAQEKLAVYMEEQARFLSSPGNTIAGWLEKVEQRTADQTAPPINEQRSYMSVLDQ